MITNFEEDSDVDEKGNIKGLIDYSDEEDIKLSEKQIRDYGKYVHRLKGKDLDNFVNKEMKSLKNKKVTSKKVTKHKNVKEESESESESEYEEVVKKVRRSKSKMMKKNLYEYSS